MKEKIETIIEVMTGKAPETKRDFDQEVKEALRFIKVRTYAQYSLIKKIFYKYLERHTPEQAKILTIERLKHEVIIYNRIQERIRFKTKLIMWYYASKN